jgi:hypothetical protein
MNLPFSRSREALDVIRQHDQDEHDDVPGLR